MLVRELIDGGVLRGTARGPAVMTARPVTSGWPPGLLSVWAYGAVQDSVTASMVAGVSSSSNGL